MPGTCNLPETGSTIVSWHDAAKLPAIPAKEAYPIKALIHAHKLAGLPVFPRLSQTATADESLIIRAGEDILGVLEGSVPSRMVVNRVSHKPFTLPISLGQSSALLCADCLLVDIEGEVHLRVPRNNAAVAKAYDIRPGYKGDISQQLERMRLYLTSELRSAIASSPSGEVLDSTGPIADKVAGALEGAVEQFGLTIDAFRLTIKPTSKFYYAPEENKFHEKGLQVLKQLEG